MEYDKPYSEDSFSTRSPNGPPLISKTHPYEGVFSSGRSRVMRSSMDENFYHEMFRLPGCTIPILDVPELEQGANDWEILSKNDYSSIFASSMDFAIPLEELLAANINAREVHRKKGGSSSNSKQSLFHQRTQASSGEQHNHSFDTAPSRSRNNRRSQEDPNLKPHIDQRKKISESNCIPGDSVYLSAKEVTGIMADVDLNVAGNDNSSIHNLKTENSIEPSLRIRESFQNDCCLRSTSGSQLAERDGSDQDVRVSDHETSQNHTKLENSTIEKIQEKARCDSLWENSVTEPSQNHYKLMSTPIQAFQEKARFDSQRENSICEPSHSHSKLEKTECPNFTGVFKLGSQWEISSNETGQNHVSMHSTSRSKLSEVTSSDEKLRESTCQTSPTVTALQIATSEEGHLQVKPSPSETSQKYTEMQIESSRSTSCTDEMLDAFEINVEANFVVGQQSPVVNLKESNSTSAPNESPDVMLEVSPENLSETSSEYHSPAFSDEEKDENSVAATSAAAVKKAIEEAQVTMKFAKELMARKVGEQRKTTWKKDDLENKQRKHFVSSIESTPFSQEYPGDVPKIIVRSLNAEESEKCHNRDEYSTSSILTHEAENDLTGHAQPLVAKGNLMSTVENELKENVRQSPNLNGELLGECITSPKETEITRDFDDHLAMNSYVQLNLGTYQWNFDENSFKTLQGRENEDLHATGEPEAPDFASGQFHDEVHGSDHEQEQEGYDEPIVRDVDNNEEDITNNSRCSNDNFDAPDPIKELTSDFNTPCQEKNHDQFIEDTQFVKVSTVEDCKKEACLHHEEPNKDNTEMDGVEIIDMQEVSYKEPSKDDKIDDHLENRECLIGGEEFNCLGSDCADIKEKILRDEGEAMRKDKIMSGDMNNIEPQATTSIEVTTTQLQKESNVVTELCQKIQENEEGETDVHISVENQLLQENNEGYWYEVTIEGITVTAELKSEEGAHACKDVFEEDISGPSNVEDDLEVKDPNVNLKEIDMSVESNQSDKDPKTTHVSDEEQITCTVAPETKITSRKKWFPERASEDDHKSRIEIHETWSPEELAEEDDETNSCSIGHPGEDDFPSEEGFMADDVENDDEDSNSQSSDERWVDNQTPVDAVERPSTSESDKTVEESQEASFMKVEHEDQIEDDEKASTSKSEKSAKELDDNERRREKELVEKRQRIAVERAIQEARERAFADAKERAQRVAAENLASKSRANVAPVGKIAAEGKSKPERAERADADDKSKHQASKARSGKFSSSSMHDSCKSRSDNDALEAKIKLERAAVERATTAARVRAFEKLLADMASGKASKEAAEKNVNEKEQRQRNYKASNKEGQSSYNAELDPAEDEGVKNNDCSYWDKMTMEKRQRTAERAAKVLAEKNKREQIAKEEQEERHRLAETLDANVKRWSSGKERNLRALLCSLQYILGADSGWQPISPNDLVTTSAVKKAYRKATLFVHPDKLQQRGATISQKYTCEKVFDLLKEARDKLSTEDR